jgi:D-alanyl-D-alanine carboxypeptidase
MWMKYRLSHLSVILALLFFLLGSSAACATAKANIAEQILDDFLASLYPASEPGAAVIVAKEGRVLLRKGYGLSDVRSAATIQPTTVFRVGSISKQFTAAGILLLVQDRIISLSDPLTKFFPEYPRFFGSVTVEHLLTHTSGLRNYPSMPQFVNEEEEYSSGSIILAIRDSALSFNPGEAWEYSDSNYFLLGLILERASGRHYCSFMADRIFSRFGMRRTSCASFAAQCDLVSTGYIKGDHGFTQASERGSAFYFSAGSILSTVDDILRWHRALKAGEVLRRDLYARIFQPFRLRSGEVTFYGYGWVVHDVDEISVIEHGGMIGGFESHILWMPDEEIFVAVLSNSRRRAPTPDVLATRIALYLSSHHLPLVDALPSPTKLSLIVGVYRTADRTYEIAVRDGHVMFLREGGSWARLVQRLDGQLLLENTLTFISFQESRKRRVSTLKVKTKYGKERIAVLEPPK